MIRRVEGSTMTQDVVCGAIALIALAVIFYKLVVKGGK